ncbi:MAG: hypothetical protein NC906_09735, partial [Candidatus Omnitrophica bacterium]|nr:hypothetical protein [Candidatus Omnitrophota bacterium]
IVEDYVLFAPQSVSFGDIKKGTQVPPRKIILAKPYAENFKVLRTNKTNCFETDLRKTKIRMFEQEFDGYEITVFLRSNLPIGLFEEKLIIYTNDRKTPRVIIPVRATIEGGIRFYPDICFFISTKNTTILKQIVTITAIPGVSFKIKEIKTDLRWVCINLITLEEGKINQLEIVLNEETVPETIKGEITVYTDNAEQPQIKIPVYGYVEGR